ncbi:hypothetical protein GCM10025771_07640 [Niveibacterium umoris]|uniref:Lcl C-terminal domain-containing protein n=1 Tax=Niveibacterium umoris TaxID=1193620 RepID=A0A840BQ81_9RHOO|nr:DUF1566 domain-containing protein [Niveibacterium umoris]MBB4013688.1 hypothetical protein [Niveibacterium umoris]
MKASKRWASALGLLAMAGITQAAPMTLVDGGLGVLDSATGLEWTANMNIRGASSWATSAYLWIDSLNTSHYAGHNDWRLPTLNPLDTSCSDSFSPGGGFPDFHYGYNCTGGELSHLFVSNLGNKAHESVLNETGDTAEQIANLALFSNVQSYDYWSGTLYAPDPTFVWVFSASDGRQHLVNKGGIPLYAVAVRTSDGAVSLPEPQTLALVLLALTATLVAGRQRPR